MLVAHDAVHEGYNKLPRTGMWNLRSRVDMRCPVCENIFHLDNHTIDADGRVSPSVWCPHTREDETPCTFHEMVVLGGWHDRIRSIPF